MEVWVCTGDIRMKKRIGKEVLVLVLAVVLCILMPQAALADGALEITLKVERKGPHPEVFYLDRPIQIGFDIRATDNVYREPLLLNNHSFLVFKGNERVLMSERMEDRIYPSPGYNIFTLDEIIKPHGVGVYRLMMVYSYKEQGEENPFYAVLTGERWFGEVVSNELIIKVIPVLPEDVKRIRGLITDITGRARYSSALYVSSFERPMDRLVMVGDEAVPYIIEALFADMKERLTMEKKLAQGGEGSPPIYWLLSTPFLLEALAEITGEDVGFDFSTYRSELKGHKEITQEEAILEAVGKWIQWWQEKVARDGVPEKWLAVLLNENGYLTGDSLASSIPSLLDALADENGWLRLHTALWLKSYSGKDFGYDASAPPAKREKAIAKWRAWQKRKEKKEKK
jgi:hypothetical protein